jgi:hypothetical protein
MSTETDDAIEISDGCFKMVRWVVFVSVTAMLGIFIYIALAAF